MNVLDLFSGIGGFSLGLERAGMRTVAFCEIDPYCRAVLRKHWPDVRQYDDVRTLTAERLATDGIVADVICGGFPCQDISVAGKGAGITGERSGLWKEYARLIGEIRPSYVIVENVAALLGRGLSTVLGDLTEIGYDAEWHVISAADVGAPHRRERIWVVAYPNSKRCNGNDRISSEEGSEIRDYALCHSGTDGSAPNNMANAMQPRRERGRRGQTNILPEIWPAESNQQSGCGRVDRVGQDGAALSNSTKRGLPESEHEPRQSIILENPATIRTFLTDNSWWAVEPDVGRVANGIPRRVDRLKGLGNAVVPQIPEIIGRAIMQVNALSAIEGEYD